MNSCSCATRCWMRSGVTRSFFARSPCCSFECGRNSCSGGSRKRIVAGIALERPEDAGEVVPLVRQQLGERRLPLLEGLGEDHLPHRVDAVALEEHVLGAAQADADGAERNRRFRLLRRVGIGADRHPGRLRAPFHQLLEVAELFGGPRRRVVVHQAGDDFGRRGLELAGVDLAGGAVDRHPIAFLEGPAAHADLPGAVVHLDLGGAADADLAHLPGHQRRVRGHAAAGREDAFGGDHAAQIFRRRLDPDQQDALALLGRRDRAVRVQVDLAGGRARDPQAARSRSAPPRPVRRHRTPAPAAARAGRPGCASPRSSSRSASP